MLIGLLIGASPVIAQDTSPQDIRPQDFAGEWQGVALNVDGAAPDLGLTAQDLNVRIDAEGNAFRVHWTAFEHSASGELSRHPIEARFAPTDRPGVFAFEPEQGSILMGLFADPTTSNPLEGEPLLWARLERATLTVYGLMINGQGGFDLYRSARTLTDEGMSVRQTHRMEGAQVLTIEGRLERVGG